MREAYQNFESNQYNRPQASPLFLSLLFDLKMTSILLIFLTSMGFKRRISSRCLLFHMEEILLEIAIGIRGSCSKIIS